MGLLKDRVAIVTGADSGIGKATAKLLAQAGAIVFSGDIKYPDLPKAPCDIGTVGGKIFESDIDVTQKENINIFVEYVLFEANRIDILVNCAGITRDTLAMRMSEEQWDQVIDVNLKGTFNMCQAVLKPMRKNKWGRIINTSSVAALGHAGQLNYASSKAGVEGLTKTLALEMVKSGITVNAVAPGAVDTPMLRAIGEKNLQLFLEKIPMGRFASPEEIAELYLYLCSEYAGYITGQVITIAGGLAVGP